jgi:hypothetical protein
VARLTLRLDFVPGQVSGMGKSPARQPLIEQYRAIEAKAHAAVTPELRNWAPDVSRGVDPELPVRTRQDGFTFGPYE